MSVTYKQRFSIFPKQSKISFKQIHIAFDCVLSLKKWEPVAESGKQQRQKLIIQEASYALYMDQTEKCRWIKRELQL